MALYALLALAWFSLLIAAPVLPVPLAGALYAIGSRICHQIPARSFHLFGSQLPVCGRCLGIYAGTAAGLLIAAMTPGRDSRLTSISPRTLLLLGGTPTALTLALEWGGAWSGSNVARAAAGIPLGMAVALVVAHALATLHYPTDQAELMYRDSRQPFDRDRAGRDIGAPSKVSRRTYH